VGYFGYKIFPMHSNDFQDFISISEIIDKMF